MSRDDMSLWPDPHDWEDAAEAAGMHLPWPGSMTFLQIGPDTPHLAAHLAGEGHVHDPGIICAHWQCVRERQAAAERRKPCGCPDYILCLCRREKPDRKHTPASGQQLKAPGHDAAQAAPALTPEQEIMAAIWEPLFLPEDRLPQYRPFGPGRCRECGLDPVKPGTNICWYCDAAEQHLKPAPAPGQAPKHAHHLRGCDGNCYPRLSPPRRAYTGTGVKPARKPRGYEHAPARRAARPAVRAAVLGIILVVLAAHIPALGILVIPGILLLAAAFAKGRRR